MYKALRNELISQVDILNLLRGDVLAMLQLEQILLPVDDLEGSIG